MKQRSRLPLRKSLGFRAGFFGRLRLMLRLRIGRKRLPRRRQGRQRGLGRKAVVVRPSAAKAVLKLCGYRGGEPLRHPKSRTTPTFSASCEGLFHTKAVPQSSTQAFLPISLQFSTQFSPKWLPQILDCNPRVISVRRNTNNCRRLLRSSIRLGPADRSGGLRPGGW